ncbi:MAG TPA: glycosyltransferase [Cyclobacteriaceae bacterium]|jgi:hypothetical protein|nr:glycosyltransferase [Cyclobacteriaceae bacterium]
MRVLYLSYDGLSDPLGRSQILPYLTGLSKEGYLITIVSFEKTIAYKEEYAEVKSLCDQSSILWIPLKYHKQPPVLSTLYDIYQLWRRVRKEHERDPFDIIHCRSYITALVGLKARREWGVKFIFDMRGFWPDERVEGGIWNLRNPIFRLIYLFFKKKEKQFLTESDHIVSLTHNAKNEIESWNIKHTPVTVIPTCVDLNLFDLGKISQREKDRLKQKLDIRNEFILLYLGSWGTWYATSEMLIFFSRLKRQIPNSKFLIVTKDKIDVADHPFKKDIIIASASRREVPLYTSLAFVSVCFIKPSFSKKASAATKMGEILALDIPFITNEGWGDVSYFEEKGSVLITKLKRDDYDHLISNELNNLSSVRHPKLDELSLASGVQRYAYIYQKIAHGLHLASSDD